MNATEFNAQAQRLSGLSQAFVWEFLQFAIAAAPYFKAAREEHAREGGDVRQLFAKCAHSDNQTGRRVMWALTQLQAKWFLMPYPFRAEIADLFAKVAASEAAPKASPPSATSWTNVTADIGGLGWMNIG